MKTASFNKELVEFLQLVKKNLSEQVVPSAGVSPETSVQPEQPQRKPTKVVFDKSTKAPFEVIFSERGFSIEGTRMSFEELETAISKNYNIALEAGKGLELDAVKMQKILKYKELY